MNYPILSEHWPDFEAIAMFEYIKAIQIEYGSIGKYIAENFTGIPADRIGQK